MEKILLLLEAFSSTIRKSTVWAAWRPGVLWAQSREHRTNPQVSGVEGSRWKLLLILCYIHFFWLINDSAGTVCNSLWWFWDLSLACCPLSHHKQRQVPWTALWQHLMPALTNACGWVYFLHGLLFQMIGSKMLTGVMGFITSLQEEIWGHLNFLNSWILSYPIDFSSYFITYIISIFLNTKISIWSNLFPSLHQVCKIFRKAGDNF